MLKYVFALLLSVSTAHAKDIRPLFEALQDSGEKYFITGTVCEQVAKLNLEKIYKAPEYTVTTGIQYGSEKRVIGELDVIVFRNANQSAVVIAEVKCWNSLGGALKKAKEQRKRFLETLGAGRKLHVTCGGQDCDLSEKNFNQVQKFISISQDGGLEKGFDMTLGYSLDEMMELRKQLMSCQERGECRRP
ncbi:hypothetical protein [Bdellovibrio sp. BCCA]|uniref:hypothetical protein n=1 Tax=Bdellovibrio sp. BCCA TaxID=3136281 RepID=UPI0030F04FD0